MLCTHMENTHLQAKVLSWPTQSNVFFLGCAWVRECTSFVLPHIFEVWSEGQQHKTKCNISLWSYFQPHTVHKMFCVNIPVYLSFNSGLKVKGDSNISIPALNFWTCCFMASDRANELGLKKNCFITFFNFYCLYCFISLECEYQCMQQPLYCCICYYFFRSTITVGTVFTRNH